MPLSLSQRVAVGRWYVEEIKRRIEVRQKASGDATAKAKAAEDSAMQAVGKRLAKAHRLGDVLRVKREHCKGASGEWAYHIIVKSKDGLSLMVPEKSMPTLLDQLAATKAMQGTAGECCKEVEFLTTCLGNGPIARFQTYVARLHAGPKEPTEAALKAILDDYLTSARPAVCKIA